MAVERIGFGGGCHWCTEAVFQSLRGVAQVEQGHIASTPPYDRYSEAVIVHFDPDQIPQTALIEAHLHTHASASEHSMRHKYRSAIYCFDDAQTARARDALKNLQADFAAPLVTQVLPFVAFKASDARFHDYYTSHPERPFCRTYIVPKLRRLEARLGDRMASSEQT